jgi:hypothetical protein
MSVVNGGFSLTASLPDLVTIEIQVKSNVLQLEVDQNILTRDFLKEVDKLDAKKEGDEKAALR